jgi:hypothetical protein
VPAQIKAHDAVAARDPRHPVSALPMAAWSKSSVSGVRQGSVKSST